MKMTRTFVSAALAALMTVAAQTGMADGVAQMARLRGLIK